MAERLRSVTVTVTVDTNKQTREQRLEWRADETIEEFEQRVAATIEQLTEVS